MGYNSVRNIFIVRQCYWSLWNISFEKQKLCVRIKRLIFAFVHFSPVLLFRKCNTTFNLKQKTEANLNNWFLPLERDKQYMLKVSQLTHCVNSDSIPIALQAIKPKIYFFFTSLRHLLWFLCLRWYVAVSNRTIPNLKC